MPARRAALERDTAAGDGTRREDDGDGTAAAAADQRVVGCSADARAGITLTAADARAGAALAGFTVVLRDAAGRGSTKPLDSVVVAGQPPVPPPPIVWAGASERLGRYALRVTKPGYRAWDTTGVMVVRDGCHVRTIRLDVRLQPE